MLKVNFNGVKVSSVEIRRKGQEVIIDEKVPKVKLFDFVKERIVVDGIELD